jgi:hypothetical protein
MVNNFKNPYEGYTDQGEWSDLGMDPEVYKQLFGPEEVESKPEIVVDPDEELTMDMLDNRSDWIEQARTIYNYENPDKKFKGTDKKLSEWFKDRHSSLNHNLTDLLGTGFDTSNMNDEVKRAWSQSMDTYENTDSDFATFFRAVQNTFEDPLTYAGLFGTGGLGLVAKIGAKKGANEALRNLLGRFEFKQQLNKQLETQIGKEAAEEFIKKGATKKATKEVLEKARPQAAKIQGNKGTQYSGLASGVLWGAGFGVGQEEFEKGIEKKDESDLFNIAISTLGGGAAGFGLGRYLPRVFEKVTRNRALRKIVDSSVPVTKVKNLTETGIIKNSNDRSFSANVHDRSLANSAELDVDGTVSIDIEKDLNNKQIEELKRLYLAQNINIEPATKGNRRKFIGTKIIPRQQAVPTPREQVVPTPKEQVVPTILTKDGTTTIPEGTPEGTLLTVYDAEGNPFEVELVARSAAGTVKAKTKEGKEIIVGGELTFENAADPNYVIGSRQNKPISDFSDSELETFLQNRQQRLKDVVAQGATKQGVFETTKREIIAARAEKARRTQSIPKEQAVEYPPTKLTGGRSATNKILARAKRNFWDNSGVGDAAKEANVRRTGAQRVAERNVFNLTKELTNAIKKDLGIKNFKQINDQELIEINRLLDQAFKGNFDNIDLFVSQKFKNSLPIIKEMRDDVQVWQQKLIDSGMIDETSASGQELALKVTKSMDGTEEYYFYRQYEAFDNPNWSTDLLRKEGGQKILDNARSLIHDQKVQNYRNWAAKADVENREKWIREGSNPRDEPRPIPLSGSRYNRKVDDLLKEAEEDVNQLLNRAGNSSIEDTLSILNKNNERYPTAIQAGKILSRRKDIPKQIRLLLGEYEDPFNNYINTVTNLSQLVSQHAYEKEIAALIRANKIPGAISKGRGEAEMIPVSGKLPSKTGDTTSLEKRFKDIENVEKEGIKQIQKLNLPEEELNIQMAKLNEDILKLKGEAADLFQEKAIEKPLDGFHAYPEVASAITMANELTPVVRKSWQNFLAFQGYTRTTKTAYSTAAIARNFMGSGMMALGAGYFRPHKVKGMMEVARGLVNKDILNKQYPEEAAEEIEKIMVKGLYLGNLQSGVDFNAFKGALSDAGNKEFWNFSNPVYKGGRELERRAKKLNSNVLTFYQAMDDVWKQFGFLNEKDNRRQILLDKGIDPDEVIIVNDKPVILKTGKGSEIPITRLDQEAGNRVNNHMQNYGNVPRFVKAARRLPFADFLAFKTEVARISKNIIRDAIIDMKEGSALMKKGEQAIDSQGNPTGLLKGQHQRNEGLRILGFATSAASILPAIGAAGTYAMNMSNEVVDRQGKGIGYSQEQGIERVLKTDWNPGHNYIYFGDPQNGKGRRLNLSYINPWANYTDLISAGTRAARQGQNVDNALTKVAMEGVINPIKDTLAPSMFLKSIYNIANGKDEYGQDLYGEKDNQALGFLKSVGTELYKAYEPGTIKSGRDLYTSLSLDADFKKELFDIEGKVDAEPVWTDRYGISEGKVGNRKYLQDQFFGMAGIKPEAYDVSVIFPLKLRSLERKRRDTIENFKSVYQDRSVINPEDLLEGYKKSLEDSYNYTQDMYDLVQQYKAAIATRNKKNKLIAGSASDIKQAITRSGLFKDRLDKKLFDQLLKNKYMPPKINFDDLRRWQIDTEQSTNVRPPIQEVYGQLLQTRNDFINKKIGMKSGGSIFDNLFATRPNINRERSSMRKGLDIVGESLGLEKYHVGDGDDTEAYVPEVIGDDTEAVGDIDNIIFNNFERLGINPDNYGIAKNNLIDFATRTKMAESSGDYKAVNIPEKNKKKTTAKGAYQFIDGSVLPALKRLEVRIGKRDWIDKAKEHKDIFKLTPLQQDALFLGDIMEKTIKKTQGLGDKYIKRILKGDIKAMKDLYKIGHHTVGRKGMSPAARKNMNYWFQ